MHEHDWAVALSKDISEKDIIIVPTNKTGYPWDFDNSPVELRVSAKYVTNWNLNEWIYPSRYPEKIETGKDLILNLEPMGGTLLRITEFPKGDF